MTRLQFSLALAFAAVLWNGQATAATVGEPAVIFVPAKSSPTPPAGLKVTCLKTVSNGAPTSDTCPVVKYNGDTVWAYSFIDNRVSIALVTYDEHNAVVGNITKNGTRYVWNAISGSGTKSVVFFGQANQWVTASWSELFPGMPTTK